MESGYELRDIFNKDIVNKISHNIKNIRDEFNAESFCKDINAGLAPLGLKERSLLITRNLKKYLPENYSEAIKILLLSLGPELESEDLTGMDGFLIMPYCGYVSQYGLDHFEISIEALYQMTKRFTAEEAIRSFIKKYPDKTMTILHQWASDGNVHVRRLVSEGTRPRLPWAEQLPVFIKDPSPVINLLEKIKHSPELYVRRSIANNLNDISKDHPKLVVDTLKIWQKDNSENMSWLIRHATRTLVKKGHKGALELLGYPANPEIKLANFKITPENLKFGNKLDITFEIISRSSDIQNLMIDYIIDFVKANNKTFSKVFKMSQK